MPNRREHDVYYSNEGAEIVVFESNAAIIEKTPRPASEVTRKMIAAQLAKEAELRAPMRDTKNGESQ